MNIWILNHYAGTPDTPGGARHFNFAKPDGTSTVVFCQEEPIKQAGRFHKEVFGLLRGEGLEAFEVL